MQRRRERGMSRNSVCVGMSGCENIVRPRGVESVRGVVMAHRFLVWWVEVRTPGSVLSCAT
jgi:hypothetical protein